MKKIFLFTAIIAGAMLLNSSCASTSKFVKSTRKDKGVMIASADLDLQTMTAAANYGCKKMGIVVEKGKTESANTSIILGTLKSSWQDWGQNIKITVMGNGQQTELYYLAKPRIKVNVTADVVTIANNFRTHINTYIEAAKEGIDLNSVDLKK